MQSFASRKTLTAEELGVIIEEMFRELLSKVCDGLKKRSSPICSRILLRMNDVAE